jgi:hypothetical protein
MFKIAIIGGGQIGSRHLQAMSLFDRPVRLQIVDPSMASLKVSQERFNGCVKSLNVLSVEYFQDIGDLPDELDLVIVATNSNVRRAVIESLLARKVVRYLILEKVLFQKTEDLDAVDQLLRAKNVHAWVNCPFRMTPFYRNLKARLKDDRKLDFAVTGSQWGLGCNGIHYLDLCAFLSGDDDFTLTSEMVDQTIIESKRSGFVEFTGTLAGRSAHGSRFAATSYTAGTAPVLITVTSSTVHCIVRETEGMCWIAEADSNWVWREETVNIPFQSQLTHLAVGNILDTGACDLVSYAESSGLHKSLLTALLTAQQQRGLLESKTCNIT